MGRITIFATVLVWGLLVSRASHAQYSHATDPLPAASPGIAAPPGYHVKSEVRLGLLVSGSIVTGLGYTLGAATLGNSSCAKDRWFLLPIAGPVIALVNEPDVSSGPCDDPEGIRHAIRAWSGIMQGIGGGLLLLAAALPKRYLVPDSASSDTHAGSRATMEVIPILGTSTAGVAILGTF